VPLLVRRRRFASEPAFSDYVFELLDARRELDMLRYENRNLKHEVRLASRCHHLKSNQGSLHYQITDSLHLIGASRWRFSGGTGTSLRRSSATATSR
jgi:hypothetical protein